MSKILVTTSSFASQDASPKTALLEAGHEIITNPFGKTLTEDQVLALLEEHRPIGMIAGVEPLKARVLRTASAYLRVISRCGTGLDNVDLATAKELGIPVLNTPEAPAEAVAEMTLALILSLIRNVAVHDREVKAGGWKKRMGFLLPELTIGIIGLGRVGKRVAALLDPFGCKMLGSDVKPDPDWIATHHVHLVEIAELLACADVVTLHLPFATGDMHHFFDQKRIGMMKKGSFLINTARGGLIDEQALHDALTGGHLAGAAVDTFEQEPYNGALIHAPNIILSPHAGSYARATRIRMEMETTRNLLTALGGM